MRQRVGPELGGMESSATVGDVEALRPSSPEWTEEQVIASLEGIHAASEAYWRRRSTIHKQEWEIHRRNWTTIPGADKCAGKTKLTPRRDDPVDLRSQARRNASGSVKDNGTSTEEPGQRVCGKGPRKPEGGPPPSRVPVSQNCELNHIHIHNYWHSVVAE
jgi:hypothetical protein